MSLYLEDRCVIKKLGTKMRARDDEKQDEVALSLFHPDNTTDRRGNYC